jgi:hypothetical protein
MKWHFRIYLLVTLWKINLVFSPIHRYLQYTWTKKLSRRSKQRYDFIKLWRNHFVLTFVQRGKNSSSTFCSMTKTILISLLFFGLERVETTISNARKWLKPRKYKKRLQRESEIFLKFTVKPSKIGTWIFPWFF